MKKLLKLIKYAAGAALAAIVAFSAVSAGIVGATGFVIDDSVFSNYDIDHMTVWYWREGLPPTEKNGTRYPVLITWNDGKYFFSIDANFFTNEKNYSNLREYNVDLPLYCYDNPYLDIHWDNGFYPYSWIGSGGWVGDKVNYVKGYKSGYYRYVCSYPATEQGLTAKLPFNITELQKQGSMISLEELSNVPYLVGRGTRQEEKRVQNVYAMGLEVPESLRPGNRYYSDEHRYAWLASLNSWDMENTVDEILYGDTVDSFNMRFIPAFTDSLTDFSKVYTPTQPDEHSGEGYLWYFYDKTKNGTPLPEHYYGFSTEAYPALYFDDDAVPGDANEFMDVAVSYSSFGYIRAEWNGSSFLTQGNMTILPTNELTNSRATFRIYYATPVIMDVLNTSITVENGQVANFDGPILINNNCTITVKEGGTLTVTAKSEANGVDLGWVMNNGKIVVEKGGTLYIQKGACLNKYNNKKSEGGGVVCSGLCIVDEDAKLCGGGLDGLQFLNGSHVVNYGALISENFKVEKDHTIENRGEKAVVLHGSGNGVTGSGYGLFMGNVTSAGYPERGSTVNTVADNVDSVGDAIYSW